MKIRLTASVGEGGSNRLEDVQSVQQRLNDLGFAWVGVDGIIGPVTIGAIRLFQSIIFGRQTVGGDGLIDPNMVTHKWLEADSAPHWQLLEEEGTGFVSVERRDTRDTHDYGTDWLSDVISRAGERYENRHRANRGGSPMAINDASLPQGGDSLHHAGHETGLSIDMRLPATDGSVRGGRTFRSADYDQEAMRAQLRAFRDEPTVDRIFFNDPVLIGEGLCKRVRGHDNHVHLEIGPPPRS